ncbi:MAG: hypothetical protein HYY66_04125 [Candidatus Tectomicrobia bacterium]|nr:hypothetical protein [Candidatus Tectomicrobia bacterium]
MEPRDLASRWEDAIHGRATAGEVDALRRELAQAGRLAEFEAQAEAAAAVRGLASRHQATVGGRPWAGRWPPPSSWRWGPSFGGTRRGSRENPSPS